MKKLFALLLAVLVALSCSIAVAAVDPTYPSPTAPTIIPPKPDEPPTGEHPTNPGGTTSPSGSTTTPSGSTTQPVVTKPTTPGSTRPTTPSTTPGGSTVTGTAKPDTNPESPKTGDTGAEVFLFSAIAMTGACALVLLRRKKDEQ